MGYLFYYTVRRNFCLFCNKRVVVRSLGFFLIEGLIAIAVFSLLSGIICFYLMHTSQNGKKAQDIHFFVQYCHNIVDQNTDKKFSVEYKKITIPTPPELRSIVKSPITLDYKKVIMRLPSQKEDQKNVLHVF